MSVGQNTENFMRLLTHGEISVLEPFLNADFDEDIEPAKVSKYSTWAMLGYQEWRGDSEEKGRDKELRQALDGVVPC